MLKPATQNPGAEKESEPFVGIDLLAEGVYAYLEQVDRDRAICRRHAGTATVRSDGRGIVVERRFEADSATIAHLHSAVRLLAGGAIPSQMGPRPRPRRVLQSCWSWEGRRTQARISNSPASVVRISLSAGPRPGGLPELPLQALAAALRCHDFLVPDRIASPLPYDGQGAGIRDYLKRAMPPNLNASQCI